MNFEQILECLKETANTGSIVASRAVSCAGKKAEEVYNISKLQVEIIRLKDEIENLYKEVGALIHATYRNEEDNSDLIREKLALVEEKAERIQTLSDAIGAIKNVKDCPYCGTKNDKDGQFCKKCGGVL